MSKALSEFGNIIGVSNSPTKADKVTNATNGHLAGLDASGNLTDSGIASENVAKASNRNLLDNPWFLVNQRGQASYSGNSETVDGWNTSANMAVTVLTNGVRLSASGSDCDFVQKHLNVNKTELEGKTFTVSIKYSDGNIDSKTFTFPNSISATVINKGVIDSTHNLFLNYQYGFTRLDIAYNITASGTTKEVVAMKLEEGARSTLVLDSVPDYTTELLKYQKANMDAIALVEPGSTAISAHAVGTYFINQNGNLCRTTSAISVGATITVGTNCVETSVGDELLPKMLYTITADGTKTYGQLLDSILPQFLTYRQQYVGRGFTIVTKSTSTIQYYHLNSMSVSNITTFARFNSMVEANGNITALFYTLESSGSKYVARVLTTNSQTDYSNEIATAGFIMELWVNK